MPVKEATLWCLNLPFETRRRLSPDELNTLTSRVKRDRRAALIRKWVGRIGFSIAGLLTAAAIWISSKDNVQTVTTLFGLGLIIPAILGTIEEAMLGSLRTRLLFGFVACWCLVAAFSSESQPEGGWHQILTMVCGSVAFFGGWGVLLLRWNEGKVIAPLLALAQKDCALGEVQRFSVPAETEKDAVGFSNIELLPESRLAYSFGERVIDYWEPLYVADIPEIEKPVASPDGDIQERALSPEESEEMNRLAWRVARNAPIRFLGIAYFCAVILRFAQNLWNWDMDVRLHPLGWLAATAIGCWFLISDILTWRDLRADAKGGKGRVGRAEDDEGKSATITVLPKSGLVWDRDGRPTPFRTSKWW